MMTSQTRLRLVGKMIEVEEKELAELVKRSAEIQARLDRLYARRTSLEREIAETERNEAPLVKTQPAGVRLGGFQV